MAVGRINPCNLPSGSGARFSLFVVTSVGLALWFGRFLYGYGPPQTADDAAGALLSGIIMVVVGGAIATALFLAHPLTQRRRLALSMELKEQNTLINTIQTLSHRLAISVPRVLSDNDIMNGDAVAFGFGRLRAVGLGRGALLMAVKRPKEFNARLAHELRHFKNGDVAYAFFARAIISRCQFV